MTHIPTKEAMVSAVRKSGCSNLNHLPLESMTAHEIYGHLVAANCPCLKRLLSTDAGLRPRSTPPSSRKET